MAVNDRVEPMLSLAPARDQSGIAETPEAFRYCRNAFAHGFRDVADACFLPGQDLHQPQAALVSNRPQ